MKRTRRQWEERLAEFAGPAAKAKVWQAPSGSFGYQLSCRMCTFTKNGIQHSRWLERGETHGTVLDGWAAHAAESHPDCGVRWRVFSPASADRL